MTQGNSEETIAKNEKSYDYSDSYSKVPKARSS